MYDILTETIYSGRLGRVKHGICKSEPTSNDRRPNGGNERR